MGRNSPRLADLLASLSLAMDLGLGLPMEWVQRCTLTGLAIAEKIGAHDDVVSDVYYLSLLRHMGCTSMAPEFAHYFGTDLLGAEVVISDSYRLSEAASFMASIGKGQPTAQRAKAIGRAMRAPSIAKVDTIQCDAACRLAEGLGVETHLVDGLRQTRERFDGKGAPEGLGGDQIMLPVRIAHVAQDLVTASLVYGYENAVDALKDRAGRNLDPSLVAAAAGVDVPAEDSPTWDEVMANEPKPPILASDIESALGAFADFADLKSSHFLGHSRRVSSLAAAAADNLRLAPDETETVRQAGLVHDVGRVAVSTAIWDKESPLTENDMERVRLHPYYTGRIISRSDELGHLADLACSHHEGVDGSGYHRGIQGASLPIAARILCAADAYASMQEPRPYRPALEPQEIATSINRRVNEGSLDGDAAAAVLEAAGQEASVTPGGVGHLTAREIEVLRLAARGTTVKEIADKLVISRKTADRHMQNVYSKLGISSRAAAAIWAMEHGLI